MVFFNKLIGQLWPKTRQRRRYMLDGDHFDLTPIEGDISEWLSRFPVCPDNAEIYSALAELFRRRGEFDKAVAVHQAISSAKPEGYDASALILEVAQDYYAAGLLGQAEEMLLRSLEHADESVANNAFRLWLNILEREQDWPRAISLIEDYGMRGSGGLRLANLYCEYVSSIARDTAKTEQLKMLKRARKLEVSVRAELLTADLLQSKGQFDEAIQVYRQALTLEPKRVDLVLEPLMRLAITRQPDALIIEKLTQLYHIHPSVRVLEALLKLYMQSDQAIPQQIEQAVSEQVQQGDSLTLVEYWLAGKDVECTLQIRQLLPAFDRLSVEQNDGYICIDCGFHSEQMLWHCPQCQSWETLYSAYELKIEQKTKKVT